MRRTEPSRWGNCCRIPCRKTLTGRGGYDDTLKPAEEKLCYKQVLLKSPTERGGRWVHVMWMGQESWTPMYSSGMNSTPTMAPLSPGLSGSPPLISMSPKNTTFQSLGSLSAGMFSPSPARGSYHHAKQASSPLNSPTPSIMSSPKLWQKASISRLAEEFFWIGGSVVAQPKWRLGQIGKIHSWHFCFQTIAIYNQVVCQKCLQAAANKKKVKKGFEFYFYFSYWTQMTLIWVSHVNLKLYHPFFSFPLWNVWISDTTKQSCRETCE